MTRFTTGRSRVSRGIHLEVQLEGRVDPARFKVAIEAPSQVHPMARARMAPHGAMSMAYKWIIPDQFEAMPLQVVRADSLDEVQARRDELMSLHPPALRSPAFALRLIQGPQHDIVLIMLNHVLADGLSTFRLITSILRHYAGNLIQFQSLIR